MSDSNLKPLPALKQSLEAIEIKHEGKPMIMLRDQEGLNDRPLALSLPGFFVAMMLNGANTVADLQSQFAKNTGALLKETEIEGLVAQLDEALMLETDNLRFRRRKIMEEFLANPVRKATMLDTAYPSQPMELAAYMGKFFADAKGPGKQMAGASASARPPLGLISPHIDLERGGPAYAWAYQALSEYPPPDVILAFGVAHMSPNSPWVLTKKSYETPYGPLAVDGEFYDLIQKRLWYDGAADEGAHRREHSLEFQALWLKYLWRDKTPPWVPILCSTFERFCPDKAPSTIPTIEKAIQDVGAALLEKMKEGKRIMILSGIDLAHVGPRFGDQENLGPELEARLEKEDRASMEHALALNADEFYLSVVAGGHWRKVCGLSALYTSLRLIRILNADPSLKGNLLTYGQAPDPLGGIVSFASAIFS